MTKEEKTMPEPAKTRRRDFFISYSSADRRWAEWIAWQLEQAGYSVALPTGDVRPGENFAQSIHEAISDAERIIVLLSPDYLDSPYIELEWAEAFRQDPAGKQRTLLPVQVRECRDQLRGLLALITYIDLVGLDEKEARKVLLAGVRHRRSRLPSKGGVKHTLAQPPQFPAGLPPIWNVPPRNPFFTDRDEILQHLNRAFKSLSAQALTQPQAISGLGGIGKTQVAIEYAYRYRTDYQAVLWVLAGSQDALVASCLSLARLLDLPEKDEQDHREIVSGVRKWLQDHAAWLLILDNADDIEIVRDFFPPTPQGHLLITTRAQALGRTTKAIKVDAMTPDEGALFLLRRAGIFEPETAVDKDDLRYREALQIVQTLGGLPLALDQAGAYIEEVGCTTTDYLELYEKHRKSLLARRGALSLDHPESVATTWVLSFAHAQQANSAATALLRLCAFLAPDEIPEEIITEGAAELGPPFNELASSPLAVNEAIAELLRYSLIQRHSENKALSMHRLVQTVLKDEMPDIEQRLWAERAVRAVNHIFPEVEFDTWPLCERYLPHALACAELVRQEGMMLLEAARLLSRAGYYLYERGRYAEAEPLCQHALAIFEHQLGPEHPDTAQSLNNLAELYYAQGRYEQAELLYERALAIREQQLGPQHPETAQCLNNLAALYKEQGKYARAEDLVQRALAIREQQLGPENPDTAQSLNNLALLYHDQGKYEQAEPLYQRALAIREQQLGPEHPDTAQSLNNLAGLYYSQDKYEQAEPLLVRALAICEQQLGSEHPDTAQSLNNLALLYQAQGRHSEAEQLYQRALHIYKQVSGFEHHYTRAVQRRLASLLREMGRPDEALEERIKEMESNTIQEQVEE
jgi:tetratricopeptide (TPR) repeat protein